MSQQINLFNPIFLKQKKYFSATAMLQGLGLLAVGCVLLSAYAFYQVNTLTREAVATQSQLAGTKAQFARVVSEYGGAGKSSALDQQILITQRELQGLEQVLGALGNEEFGSTDGYSEYLRAFARQSMDGVWLMGLDITDAGEQVSVQGRALRPDLVPTYMNRLKREPVLQGKSFDTLQLRAPREANSGFIEFNLQ
jgi:hypothetical protein